jgi:uncharacterized membrane protein YfcA
MLRLCASRYRTTSSSVLNRVKFNHVTLRRYNTTTNTTREQTIENTTIQQPASEFTQFTRKDYLKFGLVGVLGGCFGGLVGLGGNIILIPVLSHILDHIRSERLKENKYFPNFSQKHVNATCLVCVVASGLVGSTTLYFVGNHSVDVVASIVIGLFACFTARFGAKLANRISDMKLKLLLVFFMLFIAPISPFIRDWLLNKEGNTIVQDEQVVSSTEQNVSYNQIAGYAVLGSIVGMMSGLLGVGGGILMVPSLSFMWSGQPDKNQKVVIGTSLASMTVPSIIACYSHFRLGNVVTRMTPLLVGGAMCGSICGGYLSGKVLDEETLKYIFAISIALLGVKQLHSTIKLKKFT